MRLIIDYKSALVTEDLSTFKLRLSKLFGELKTLKITRILQGQLDGINRRLSVAWYERIKKEIKKGKGDLCFIEDHGEFDYKAVVNDGEQGLCHIVKDVGLLHSGMYSDVISYFKNKRFIAPILKIVSRNRGKKQTGFVHEDVKERQGIDLLLMIRVFILIIIEYAGKNYDVTTPKQLRDFINRFQNVLDVEVPTNKK